MKIETIDFGPQEVDAGTLITFPMGIAGFEESKEFSLLREKEDAQVMMLQSASDPGAAFSVINPEVVGLRYEFDLDDEETALLEATSAESLAVMVITYKKPLAEGAEGRSAHLNYMMLRPLVINTESRKGLMKDLVGAKPLIVIKAGAAV